MMAEGWIMFGSCGGPSAQAAGARGAAQLAGAAAGLTAFKRTLRRDLARLARAR